MKFSKKNESKTPKQPKSIEEIYKDKKQQLASEQAALTYDRQMFKQDTRIGTLQKELEQFEQQLQAVRQKNKKSWAKVIVFWIALYALVAAGWGYQTYEHNKELEAYQQQRESELAEHSAEIEKQKQELQQQIEEATQQLESTKS